jgi:hypothetical protein
VASLENCNLPNVASLGANEKKNTDAMHSGADCSLLVASAWMEKNLP